MDELEPLPISALEHFSYCPRQAAIIHSERIFEDNVFTDRGQLAHGRAHSPDGVDGNARFAMRIWSERHGLTGIADAVELRPSGPYPVEYKLGARRRWVHEAIQLCAQAFCLEEMFDCDVPEGAVYYQSSRARRTIQLDADLRGQTLTAIEALRETLERRRLPDPVADKRCRHCSLNMTCLPQVVVERRRLGQFKGAVYRLRD
ncbi:MAG: CRISPR-associated protein Cas4 [Candidatus Dormibacteraceae bacterium]